MAYTTTLQIQPNTLTDLTVTVDLNGSLDTYTLSDFTISGDSLEGNITYLNTSNQVTISSTGYHTVVTDISAITNTVVTLNLEFSNFEANSTKYYCKDETARNSITNIETVLNGKVSKAGDTMTGTLIIDKSSNTDYIYLDSTDIQRGVTPSANKYIMLKMRDTNDDLLAQYYYRLDTNGKPRAHMTCYNNDGSKQAVVMTGFDANDNAECSFPNTTCVDGQWVDQSVDLASNVSMAASASKNYSLSSYLPNDGAIYEVKFSIEGETGSTSGNGLEYRAYSDVLTSSTRGGVIAGRTRSSSTMLFASSFILPIGSARKIYIDNSNSSSSSTLVYLRAQGYRRVGTNA